MHYGYHLAVTRDISNIISRQIPREFMETDGVSSRRLADTDPGIIISLWQFALRLIINEITTNTLIKHIYEL